MAPPLRAVVGLVYGDPLSDDPQDGCWDKHGKDYEGHDAAAASRSQLVPESAPCQILPHDSGSFWVTGLDVAQCPEYGLAPTLPSGELHERAVAAGMQDRNALIFDWYHCPLSGSAQRAGLAMPFDA